jgi:hypothetical protein
MKALGISPTNRKSVRGSKRLSVAEKQTVLLMPNEQKKKEIGIGRFAS